MTDLAASLTGANVEVDPKPAPVIPPNDMAAEEARLKDWGVADLVSSPVKPEDAARRAKVIDHSENKWEIPYELVAQQEADQEIERRREVAKNSAFYSNNRGLYEYLYNSGSSDLIKDDLPHVKHTWEQLERMRAMDANTDKRPVMPWYTAMGTDARGITMGMYNLAAAVPATAQWAVGSSPDWWYVGWDYKQAKDQESAGFQRTTAGDIAGAVGSAVPMIATSLVGGFAVGGTTLAGRLTAASMSEAGISLGLNYQDVATSNMSKGASPYATATQHALLATNALMTFALEKGFGPVGELAFFGRRGGMAPAIALGGLQEGLQEVGDTAAMGLATEGEVLAADLGKAFWIGGVVGTAMGAPVVLSSRQREVMEMSNAATDIVKDVAGHESLNNSITALTQSKLFQRAPQRIESMVRAAMKDKGTVTFDPVQFNELAAKLNKNPQEMARAMLAEPVAGSIIVPQWKYIAEMVKVDTATQIAFADIARVNGSSLKDIIDQVKRLDEQGQEIAKEGPPKLEGSDVIDDSDELTVEIEEQLRAVKITAKKGIGAQESELGAAHFANWARVQAIEHNRALPPGAPHLTPKQVWELNKPTVNGAATPPVTPQVGTTLSQNDVRAAQPSATALPDTLDIGGVQRSTTNSDGKPIAQTEDGVRNFWHWFGDSKVVDDKGRPLPMYHGTTNPGFTEFRGGFFTSDKRRAAKYTEDFAPEKYGTFDNVPSGGIYPVYLKLGNPGEVFEDGRRESLRMPESTDGAMGEGRGDENLIAIVKSPEQVKSATGNSGEFDGTNPSILNQNDTAPRGNYDPATRIINMLKDADKSTLVHESAHFFLDTFTRIAQDPNASPYHKEQLASFNTWVNKNAAQVASSYNKRRKEGAPSVTADEIRAESFGPEADATNNAAWVAKHEYFARGFEQYVMDGKAPTKGMRSLYARFAKFLTKVYGALTLDVTLDDDMRAVYRRLLATDAMVAAAEKETDFAEQVQGLLNVHMSTEDVQKLMDKHRVKVDDLQADALEHLAKRAGKDERAKRALYRHEMGAVMQNEPWVIAYHVYNSMFNGNNSAYGQVTGKTINTKEATEKLPADQVKWLREHKLLSDAGLSFDEFTDATTHPFEIVAEELVKVKNVQAELGSRMAEELDMMEESEFGPEMTMQDINDYVERYDDDGIQQRMAESIAAALNLTTRRIKGVMSMTDEQVKEKVDALTTELKTAKERGQERVTFWTEIERQKAERGIAALEAKLDHAAKELKQNVKWEKLVAQARVEMHVQIEQQKAERKLEETVTELEHEIAQAKVQGRWDVAGVRADLTTKLNDAKAKLKTANQETKDAKTKGQERVELWTEIERQKGARKLEELKSELKYQIRRAETQGAWDVAEVQKRLDQFKADQKAAKELADKKQELRDMDVEPYKDAVYAAVMETAPGTLTPTKWRQVAVAARENFRKALKAGDLTAAQAYKLDEITALERVKVEREVLKGVETARKLAAALHNPNTDTYRTLAANPPYLHFAQQIAAKFGGQPYNGPTVTYKDLATPPRMPEVLFDETASFAGDPEKMPSRAWLNLADVIASLQTTAEADNTSHAKGLSADRKSNIVGWIAEIVAGESSYAAGDMRWRAKALRGLHAIGANGLRLDSVMQVLGATRDGVSFKYLTAMHDASTAFGRHMQEYGKEITEFFQKELKGEQRRFSKMHVINKSVRMSGGEMITAAAHYGSVSGRERVLSSMSSSYRIADPEAVMQDIFKSMTPGMWKMVEKIWSLNEQLYGHVIESHETTRTTPPPRIEHMSFQVGTKTYKGGYMPVRWAGVVPDMTDMAESLTSGSPQGAMGKQSFENERSKNRESIMNLSLDVWLDHIAHVNRVRAYRPLAMDVMRILKDTDFQAAVTKAHGPEFNTTLGDLMRGVFVGSNAPSGDLERVVDYMTKRTTEAALLFSVKTAVRQLSGLSNAIKEVGAKHMAIATATVGANTVASWRQVRKESDYMAERGGINDPNMHSTKQSMGTAAERIKRWGFSHIALTQGVVDTITYTGAKLKSQEADPKKPESYHITQAELAVARSQGGSRDMDKSVGHLKSAMGRALMTFATPGINLYNQLYVAGAMKNWKQLARVGVWSIAGVAVIDAMWETLMGNGPEDDAPEDWAKFLGTLVASQGLSTTVWGRLMEPKLLQGKDFTLTGLSAPSKAANAVGEMLAVMGDKDFDDAIEPATRNAVQAVAITLGLPNSQGKRLYDAVIEMRESGMSWHAISLALWGKPAPGR